MSSYVSADLRRIVVERADFLCEYCLIAEVDTFCEVDHQALFVQRTVRQMFLSGSEMQQRAWANQGALIVTTQMGTSR